MEFGKVKNVDDIDFTIPQDHPDNAAILGNAKLEDAKIYIGGTAWAEKSFVGKIYPLKCKTSDFLQHYSKNFNTVEFNSTYYALPRQETMLNWKAKVAKDFVFCPKISHEISHELELVKAQEATKHFIDCVSIWEQHLGVSFLVLPLHFSVQKKDVLKKYIQELPNNFPFAIEFRHPSWLEQDNKKAKSIFRLLQDYNVGMVITDVSGRRDCLHQRITTDTVLIRFVGNNLHRSDLSRLENWAEKLEQWLSQGLRNIYFFIHQYQADLAIDTTILFAETLKRRFPFMEIKSPSIIKHDIQQTFF